MTRNPSAVRVLLGALRDQWRSTLQAASIGRRLLAPLLIRHWRAHAGLLVLVFVEIALTLVTAWLMGAMTDAAVGKRFEELLGMIPWAVGIVALNIAAGYIGIHLQLRASDRLMRDMREQLLRHILLLPPRYTDQSRAGTLLTHFNQDIYGIEGMIGSNLIQILRFPIIFAAVLIYMAQIHWALAVVSIAAAPLVAVVGGTFGLLLKRNSRATYDQVERMNVFLSEIIHGLSVIRSFTLEKQSYDRYTAQSERLYGLALQETRLRGIYSAFGQVAGSGIFLFSLCFGAYLVSTAQITVGSMVAFLNLTGHLIYPLTGMAGLWIGFQNSIPALERLAAVLDQPTESTRLSEYTPSEAHGLPVRFEDVCFGYDDEHRVIHHIGLHIEAGQTVAIVGPSGAGKSTLFALLQGLYRPQYGEITVGNIPIDRLSPAELRSSIAVVSQDTFLFAGTIRDNLLLARPGVTEAEMVAAARAASLHDFIMEQPEGYETKVGERGIGLSGGQRQRIAIVRAILKDAPILLLDEATSALDSETEHEVQQALEQLQLGRTTIVIAHRLSTVIHADRIIVMQEGRIVEAGRHDELVQQSGPYQRLLQRQLIEQSTSA
ncbi:ABC transporter ATP-binding protein [Paenibacillus soyae]|uniref:ABC transporter ATP-binding protein/permease n=1 Tax=Paenibacillus soyae TaxID=2969249 RepID=A0A9X2SD26_9BACL|nr:ABC transporter ATP-binding protein/permease [Paenibacillus soyae]